MRAVKRSRLVGLVLVPVVALAILAGGDLLPVAQNLIIPMYVYPADIPGHADGEAAWSQACANAPAGDTGASYLVANVYDGVVNPRAIAPTPGDPATADGFADPHIPTYRIAGSSHTALTVDPNYAKAIANCAGSVRVLGYVSTRYGATPLGRAGSFDPATVLGQVDLWHRLYPEIAGIFLDEVSSDPGSGHAAYYAAIGHGITGAVVANVGAAPSTSWLLDGGADVLVMYEGDAARFSSFVMPTWTTDFPAGDFAVVVHNTGSPDQVLAICARSRDENVGTLYVTDGRLDSGNPYAGLPSPPIWDALLKGC
jgi:hypothetical protein